MRNRSDTRYERSNCWGELIMKRLLVSILASTIMFSGYAHSVGEFSLPPLDRQTQIPMNRLLQGDQLQQHQLVYVQLADNQNIPPDGTIELFRERIAPRRAVASSGSDPCASFRNVLPCVAGYFAPAIILPVAIVALPFIAAHEFSKARDAESAVSATEPIDSATESTGGGSTQPAIDESVLRKEKERILSQERHAQWLASVVMEEQWSSALDDSYISALNQALGWKAPPLKSSAEQYKQLRLGSGISRIMLLDSKLGERTLILCARSSVEQAGVSVRHFETCQSGNMGPAIPYDSPASSEALRAVLLEQTSKLAALQAKALTEQSEFVQGKW